MYVHYFVYWSKDANNSRFAMELRKIGANFQIFSENISFDYKNRLRLYFIARPRVVIFAIRQGLKSLFTKPKPDIIAASSHIELAVFGLLKKLFWRHKLKLALLMFIYTSGRPSWKTKLKYQYLRLILSQASLIICHSRKEVEDYTALFRLKHTRFVYIPYALNVTDNIDQLTSPSQPYVLSAGRSGRDYDLLIKVFKELPHNLHIICDSADALGQQKVLSSNIKILRNCHGESYLKEIKNSSLVVIPLKADDISAGQMVMLQAMAYRKPIIITRTATTMDYVQHNETAWLVEKGDFESLRIAVNHLMLDHATSNRLAENGRRLYESQYSMYIRNIQHVLNQLFCENKIQ